MGGGGWGHSYKQCPSKGGINWRALSGSQQGKETVKNEGKEENLGWGAEGSRYDNPDPLCRLIGPRNGVEVIVNDERVIALVESGSQISAISMAFAKCHGLPIWQL